MWARSAGGDQVYLVDGAGEHHFSVRGKVGYPFFGELVRDCLDRTERAMTQEHAFKAAELCIVAEQEAKRSGMTNAQPLTGPGRCRPVTIVASQCACQRRL